MDTHRKSPDPGGGVGTPQASELVAACETAWAAIQVHHPGVPDAVIVLGSGVERGRLVKLGHWWGGRWVADGNVRGEVLLAGEALHLAPETVFEVLLHEAAHGLNTARGVQDSSRGGRYHNARFRRTAEEIGLVVAQAPLYGWARTSIGPAARERYEHEVTRLGDAMRIARCIAAGVQIGESKLAEGANAETNGGTRPRHDRQQPATCGCGRRMRMAPKVLAQGPVFCGVCSREFSVSRTVGHQVASQRGPETADPERPSVGNVESSFVQSRDASELQPMQRDGLAVLVELGTKRDGALLLTEVGAWYAARSSNTQRPLVGSTPERVESANRAARAMLKLDGTLREPKVAIHGRELCVGELVTLRDPIGPLVDVDGADLPPFAVFGTVEHVDQERGCVVVDFATAGRQTLALDSPAVVALEYGYAQHADMTVEGSTEHRTVSQLREREPPAINPFP